MSEKPTRATGPGRLLIAVYGIFALAATARAVFQIATKFSEAPLAYILSALAGLIYIAATITLSLRGVRWYWASVCAVVLEFLGVLVVGALSVFDAKAFPHDTVWSAFGRGYGFVPLALPILGMIWLYVKRPSRVKVQDDAPK